MRRFWLSALATAVAGVLTFGIGAGKAQAHDPGYFYYGNGVHDFVPHWHESYTPYGQVYWYGLGAHDFRSHWHYRSPYTYEGFNGYQRSFYRPYYGW